MSRNDASERKPHSEAADKKGRTVGVDAVAEAPMRSPDDLAVVREAAVLAARNGEHARAVELWQRLVRRASLNPLRFRTSRFSAEARFGIVAGLTHLRRFAEADEALKQVSRRFPLHPEVMIARGKLAMAREDYDAAIVIWRRFRLLFPWNAHGWDHLGRCVAAKRLALEADTTVPQNHLMPVEVVRVRDEAACKLLLGFESVGTDCEFGMVQRRYGAEPLGLLRWNFVPFANLMAAIDAGFAGMGDPENTEFWFPEDGSETYIKDRRWGLQIHTFKSKAQVDEAEFYPKACRRVAFLRDKFLADLAIGEKIIVFKSAEEGLPAFRMVHAGLQKFGRVRVLGVVQVGASSSEPGLRGKPGEVFRVSEGLYIGFLRRMGSTAGRWNIAFEDWLSICRGIETARALPERP